MRRMIAAIAGLVLAAGSVAAGASQEQADIFVTIGQYFLAQGDTAKAFEAFDKAIDEESDYAPAYLARAQAWRVRGEFQKAVDDVSHVMRLGLDRSPYVYTARGDAWAAGGDHRRAVADYDHALSLNPGFWPAFAGRGVALVELGEHDRALADLDRAIAHDPGTIKETLSTEHFQVLARKGPGGQGTRTLTATVQTAPLLPAVHAARGKLRFVAGAYKPALADLDAALQRMPALQVARLHRGLTLLALGRCAAGEGDLRRLDAEGKAALAAALALHRTAVEKGGCEVAAP